MPGPSHNRDGDETYSVHFKCSAKERKHKFCCPVVRKPGLTLVKRPCIPVLALPLINCAALNKSLFHFEPQNPQPQNEGVRINGTIEEGSGSTSPTLLTPPLSLVCSQHLTNNC